jgi:MFS family permease
MSHVTLPEIEDDDRARRAVPILVWAQAVLGAQMTVHFILGGLAGILLAENKALATLPITMIVLGATLAAPVMSWIMGRWGRRTGFLIGAAAGALGGALAAQAMIAHSFAMLLTACLITGIYMAAHNFYRFAAVDLASWAYRPRAIAWVLAGGLAAALFGPQLVIWFKDALASYRCCSSTSRPRRAARAGIALGAPGARSFPSAGSWSPCSAPWSPTL